MKDDCSKVCSLKHPGDKYAFFFVNLLTRWKKQGVNLAVQTLIFEESGIYVAADEIVVCQCKLSSISVVFNLFHAATHLATQFELTTPFQKFSGICNAVVFAQ